MAKFSNISLKHYALLLSAVMGGRAMAAMPAASLPLEPASSDQEVLSSASDPVDGRSGRVAIAPETHVTQPAFEQRQSRSLSTEPGSGDFSAQVRVSLVQDGFGAQLKLVQYPRAWLGITETFRYIKNEEDSRAYFLRRGFLVGVDLQPYRSSFVSPFLNAQLGWENFERPEGRGDVNSPVTEASAGLELRLTRFASVVGQWTEAYYANMDDNLFYPNEKKDPKRHAAAEILFNLKWERNLF
ncbi:MAG: hypothetical protein EOP10_16065 [Proteobacteria bacterium]|nr:MAG: hypothetical protein EOP10_16065 [Pseudomonadota bacterium]